MIIMGEEVWSYVYCMPYSHSLFFSINKGITSDFAALDSVVERRRQGEDELRVMRIPSLPCTIAAGAGSTSAPAALRALWSLPLWNTFVIST